MRGCVRWIAVRYDIDAGRSAHTRREISCFIGMAGLHSHYTELSMASCWLT
jgi:hypothetical protein